ncbi:MAG TPA: FtsW/RodA/SpoVE family cell cycle protein, partial [Candidatus Sulfotelmatobacter sp.]|nr:FtsW/RodA/SpoVE family cell cycle protein [Candidatus Sulfotelmatobacter sp.]
MPKPKKIDYIFLFAVLALSAIGLVMIFSASPTMGVKHGDAFFYIKHHIFYLGLGVLALLYSFNLDLENLQKRAVAVFGLAVALLLLVFIPGVGRNVLGASRWIDLGLLSFQPSEFIKIALVLFLAKWLADNQAKLPDPVKGFLPPLFFLGLVSVPIMLQPDMGTTITLATTVFAMLFIAGTEVGHILAVGGLGVLGLIVLSVVSPYRLRRLTSFLDPWQDPQGAGFQVIQSLIAVGSGGLLGVGLGASRQKYSYLPQQFTDFIFAILCEELGLIG